MVAACLFITFAVLLLIGTPIAICLGISSMVAMIVQGAGRPIEVVLGTLPQLVSASTSKFVLLAIPFFILGGNIMEKAGISQKLITLAQACVGHLRGGVAMVCVIVACFFAAISGSGPATVAALGLILIPAMVKVGYSPAFSAALMGAAGAIGVIIPPSITFVVYGSISDTSIGTLFIAGVLPGLLMGLALVLVSLWVGRKSDLEILPKASGAQRWAAFKDAFWGLMMPVIILGGIYGGVFTPTEAAAVSAVYGLLVGAFIYKTIKWKELYQILVDSASTTATVMLITAAASIFAYILTRSRIDVAINEALISATGGNTIIFFLIVNIILLLAGCFLDSTSALYIFVPLFVPVAKVLGIDLVHLGVVMIVNLAIGLVTPPVGVNLYVACGIAKCNLKQISVAVLPLIVAALIVLLLVTYIPAISLVFV
ncbi:TRAP transporter large permease subunit [Anaerotignum lactatifermentans]|uniref:TRAP transporter large permease subunit n=1 Tax=Anaerotignum lactatifermentans TaxID=160404 RepID=A0ABS2GAG6_9FIRM|nr:TRAP transporter large permease subunit [Anaerotignum lactatifermentans]MBM6829207.1 TRAP transporter large permease subunit [Anaerotignum lactatifermentans]MBM6877553.1 TRAP transporter large permease subunit [Anaerotignum lactatifermentans]MBM6950785.1 TRAP transporter large permease subunit [Anaerotignum lactatifermentans]